MNKKIFCIAIALSTLLFSLGLARPVSADGPVIIPLDNSFEIPDIGYCQTPITYQSQGYIIMKGWQNEAGNFTQRFETFQNMNVTMSGNGQILKVNVVGPVHFRIEWVSDTFGEAYAQGVGPADFVVAPGMGPVFGTTGMSLVHWHITLVNGMPTLEYQGIVKASQTPKTNLKDFCAYFGSVPW